MLETINKPEKIIKRIIKAVGQRQSVLLIGSWGSDEVTSSLLKGIKENENSIQITNNQLKEFPDNSFTRIIADYSLEIFNDKILFFSEARRLLLPTGTIIISANNEDGILIKFLNSLRLNKNTSEGCSDEEDPERQEGKGKISQGFFRSKKIKPKVLQDQIHDNGFLIDGYYGYPGGHLLMMAQIQNKNVTTLFSSEKQETVKL